MRKASKKWWMLLAACSAGTLFQTAGFGGGCMQYGAQFAAQAFNVCSVLNCDTGTFFNFCNPIMMFVDCL